VDGTSATTPPVGMRMVLTFDEHQIARNHDGAASASAPSSHRPNEGDKQHPNPSQLIS